MKPLLPKGIHRIRPLPDQELGALWNSIILDEQLKSQMLSQAMLNFTLRGKVDRSETVKIRTKEGSVRISLDPDASGKQPRTPISKN